MRHFLRLFALLILTAWITACGQEGQTAVKNDTFKYQTEQFADIRIIRYQMPGFEQLSLQQKRLVYYLSQAAYSGRDIIWDQNYRYNLRIRRTLENIVKTYSGERSGEEWDHFMVYTKRVWFSNGIHHHYASLKFEPGFSPETFESLVRHSDAAGFPLLEGETVDDLLTLLRPILFDPQVDAKKVNLAPDVDQVLGSATNFYGPDVTQKEAEAFYQKQIDPKDPEPVSYGLNSQLAREEGKIVERVWKQGGLYGPAIEKICYWLGKAVEVAENDQQRAALEKLIEFYQTGDLKTFDEYSILWLKDTESTVDTVNGFIEVYGDPLGYKGSFEAIVSFRDAEASKRIATLGANAQWFEDHSPLMEAHKKAQVTGISAKVITVAAESGDASPSTPIGINLPNPNWIRKEHGSKSVNLGNIVYAYDESAKASGLLEEFAYDQAEIDRSRQYGSIGDNLHTDLHEVIGHASGQINPGVGTPKETLKSYASTLEEGRADLVALYYLMDPKLIELGVMPTLDTGKAAYDDYIRNGLMVQLARLKPGENLEEAHMRNRQMVAMWAYRHGLEAQVIDKVEKDGKTYFVIRDYEKLRELFGQLLREVQRIKSEGDYEAGRQLVEEYGVQVDRALHDEVLARYAKLHRAPYGGFINPRLVPVTDAQGTITDIAVEYPDDFTQQMLYYAENYSFLPTVN